MVSQPRRHRRAPFDPAGLVILESPRPHRPAEVVTVQAQVGAPLWIPPALGEPVRLAGLPGVGVGVRPVLPLDERRVDPPAYLRQALGHHPRRRRPEDPPRADFPPPAFLPPL